MVSSAVTALSHILVLFGARAQGGHGKQRRGTAALASTVSYSTNLAILCLYTRLSGACKRTWTGFSMEAFKDLHQFAELAVPSAMMVCLEWWTFELLVLLSGLLPNPKLQTSVLSICDEEEVVAYIARMIPVLGVSFFVDGIHTSLSGVLYGCGEQKIGARVNLAAFYLAGIPLAMLLAFVLHLNGMGLWLGIVCGSLTKFVLLVRIVLCTNWENESIKAKDMVLGTSRAVA
ncbi:hypothetical protein VPH35_132327 [Triticum aestivum]